jgi:hypothetical protein
MEMEAVCSAEALVDFYQNILLHISENSTLRSHNVRNPNLRGKMVIAEGSSEWVSSHSTANIHVLLFSMSVENKTLYIRVFTVLLTIITDGSQLRTKLIHKSTFKLAN